MTTVEPEFRSAAGVAKMENSTNAALYMEKDLSGPVRSSIGAVLHNRPRDPIRFLAQSLREQQHKLSSTADDGPVRAAHTVKEDLDTLCFAIERTPQTATTQGASTVAATPPFSLHARDGKRYQVRPLTADFARRQARLGRSETLPPTPLPYPSVCYREASSIFEVGSCLHQLQQLSPQAPLLFIIEPPAPTSTVVFYEGAPYACSTEGDTGEKATADLTEDIRDALANCGGTVQHFSDALRSTATEASSAVRVEFLSALQTNYLAVFDQIAHALDEADTSSSQGCAQATGELGAAAAPAGAAQPVPSLLLPSVLLVSYRAETARLTYARLLAAYGPYYEAAQRRALQALRHGQLERKKKFTFAFTMEYWTQVQRRRETASYNSAASTRAAPAASTDISVWEGNVEEINAADAFEKKNGSADAVASASAIKTLAREKRAAARSAKRNLPTYDADQQAEDDVFLVVIRRLEHAAATFIQSVYRGHRARVRCQKEYSARSAETHKPHEYEYRRAEDVVGFGVGAVPPLLRASLKRLCEEDKQFYDIWTDCPTSPFPDSRRCWIYRPVQRVAKSALPPSDAAGDSNAKEAGKSEVTRVREDWVQEELLIPPLRATQPRTRINLAQRLTDYLAVAQCTLLRDTVQLLADSPGMSVLQRRAYDNVKSICLTLFFIAYAELRQRNRQAVPLTFSQYMRDTHDAVLTWFQFPHETSLLLRADRERDETVEDVEQRAAAEYVQTKLAAHEAFLVAYNTTKNAADARDAASGEELIRLSAHLFLSLQPLLSSACWAKDLERLVEVLNESNSTTGSPSAEKPIPTVNWWSIAAVPLCSVEDTPVAAIGRFDTQFLDGVPAYDCFVPRLRTVTADGAMKSVEDSAELYSGGVVPVAAAVDATISIDKPSTTELAHEWLCGNLADAADGALAKHTRTVICSEGYLECCRVSTCRAEATTTATSSFIDVPHDAVLTKYVAVRHADVTVPQTLVHNNNEDHLRPDVEESVTAVAESSVRRPRSVERRGGSERVMEAIANELSASRCDSLKQPSITASPHARVHGCERGGYTPSQPSLSSAGSANPANCRDEVTALDDNAASLEQDVCEAQASTPFFADSAPPHRQKKTAWTVRTVTEVADQVAAAGSSTVVLRHTRRMLRFIPGLDGAKQLDDFVDRVVAIVMNSSSRGGSMCLVLGMDAASQAFFALAAMLIDQRLYNARGVFHVSSPMKGEVTLKPLQSVEQDVNVDSDEYLRFLCGYHEILHSTLMDTSTSGTPNEKVKKSLNTSVQVAVAHVSAVLSATTAAAPSLNLLSRLKHALQCAEEAQHRSLSDVQFYTTAAVQLAEQYAWLVLLEWYLWSPNFPFSNPNSFSPVRRRSLAQAVKQHGIAGIMRAASPAMEWIDQMDPWATAPERCPDPLHRRYSNGLRRWDDRHYVCFGAL